MAKLQVEIELTTEQLRILADSPYAALPHVKQQAAKVVTGLAQNEVYRRARKLRRGAA